MRITLTPLLVLTAGGGWLVAMGLAMAQINLVNSSAPAPLPTVTAPANHDIAKKLQVLATKIQARSEEERTEGTRATPKTWADILQGYDAILAEHKNEKTDDVAQAALAKDLLYSGSFNIPEVAIPMLEQTMKDFPGTTTARMALIFLNSLHEEVASLAARRQLIGTPLPDFMATDLNGKVLTRAGLKNKVALLEYWTSDCIRFDGQEELPNVQKTYAKYHTQGFEVLGMLGLTVGNAAAQARLPAYLQTVAASLQAKNMSWPEYCQIGDRNDAGALANLPEPLSYPGNYLVGRDGKIIGVDLFGEELDAAVARALIGK